MNRLFYFANLLEVGGKKNFFFENFMDFKPLLTKMK